MPHYSFERVAATVRERSIPEPNSGCLIWEGLLDKIPANRLPASGYEEPYGVIMLRGRITRVHRVAFEERYGPIPPDGQVLHRCDVRTCVNPDHLYLGDNAANIADKMAKDRGRKRSTLAVAKQMHRLYAEGMRVGEIARRFDLHSGFVSNVLSGKRRPLAMPATQE